MKLVIREPETEVLRTWLGEHQDQPWVAGELCRVEVIRAVSRVTPSAVPAARAVLTALELVPLETWLLEDEATVSPPAVRSLGAVHLATARSLGSSLTAFVVYDSMLAAAAERAGLPVVAPS